ncbi:MAG TPA: hypothetical protein VHL59_06080 [Thermoanaerobaculia bacterium]|nr:hypothetical protein [Thermoanaerobaculia bacterium]
MKTFAAALLTIVLVQPAVIAGGSADARIPRIAHRDDGGAPLWVSASEALLPNGDLRAELFNSAYLDAIEKNRVVNVEQCTRFMSRIIEGVIPVGTIEERVSASYTIVAGEVTAAEEGFYAGMPGTLFALRISSRPKILGHSPRSEFLYFFVGSARIATPYGFICSTAGPGAAVLPAIGDRMVVFAHFPAQDQSRELMYVNPRTAFVIERRGTLLAAIELKSGRAENLKSVLDAISRSKGLRDVPSRWQQ